MQLTSYLVSAVHIPDGETVSAGTSHMLPKHRIYVERTFSEPFHQVAELCLLRHPGDRPTAAQLLTHTFFKYCRRNYNMIELLHPVIPMSDRIANNPGTVHSHTYSFRYTYIHITLF